MKEKIVHLCMTVFTDSMAYQENILTKYHAKMGYDVTVITSMWKYDIEGKLAEDRRTAYINPYGVCVRRLPIKGKNNIRRKFRKFSGVYDVLCEEKPDILFIHGSQYIDISVIVKYIKTHKVSRVYVDNHADFSNSATNWLSKNVLHKIIWRHYAHMIEPYTDKFYGVLPARVDFLTDVYKLPKEKCELLIMGADGELVISAKGNREETRKKYNIGKADFLIVTGGKIDCWKTQTILLEEAVESLQEVNVRLIIFGSIINELKDKVMSLCNEHIVYVGWLSREETYDLIAASDLAVYPGRHSTLWEQTAGQAVPMIVKHWEGTHHVDVNGNVEFLYEDSSEEIQEKLEELLKNPDKYQAMKQAADGCAEQFRYGNIARKSIQEK
ncbi:MAG: glycosyltransferase family 4 protein [Butyrivibrio sp.]|nr:glycosyltransferase family 4 protein [Butyrivibrio sp.]